MSTAYSGTLIFAETDDQGRYALNESVDKPGAPPGIYQVRITTFRDPNPEDEPPQPLVRERVPARYNVRSDLRRELTVGENVVDFALESAGQVIQPRGF